MNYNIPPQEGSKILQIEYVLSLYISWILNIYCNLEESIDAYLSRVLYPELPSRVRPHRAKLYHMYSRQARIKKVGVSNL